jgi:hypothetical protein
MIVTNVKAYKIWGDNGDGGIIGCVVLYIGTNLLLRREVLTPSSAILKTEAAGLCCKRHHSIFTTKHKWYANMQVTQISKKFQEITATYKEINSLGNEHRPVWLKRKIRNPFSNTEHALCEVIDTCIHFSKITSRSKRFTFLTSIYQKTWSWLSSPNLHGTSNLAYALLMQS